MPKLHKSNISLRLVISSIQSSLYNLSKLLSNVLNNIIDKYIHFFKDSFDFKNFMSKISISRDRTVFSLDIISLYTNIFDNLIKNNNKNRLISDNILTSLTKKFKSTRSHPQRELFSISKRFLPKKLMAVL